MDNFQIKQFFPYFSVDKNFQLIFAQCAPARLGQRKQNIIWTKYNDFMIRILPGAQGAQSEFFFDKSIFLLRRLSYYIGLNL